MHISQEQDCQIATHRHIRQLSLMPGSHFLRASRPKYGVLFQSQYAAHNRVYSTAAHYDLENHVSLVTDVFQLRKK